MRERRPTPTHAARREVEQARELELSVVIPVYDEEASVEPLCGELSTALPAVTDDYEIIFVDDGSQDRTLNRLRSVSAREPRVKVLHLGRNYGQSAAIQAGFDRALGRVVVTMDGDLQNHPADISRLVERLFMGYDVVSGWRKSRKDSFLTRRLPSMAANWLIAKVTKIPIHDNGCTLRAYRRRVVRNAQLYAEMHRFLVPMLSLSGSRVTEIPVGHRRRPFGQSKYGLSRIWKVLLDLVTVRMLIRFASHPAAWFAVLAAPFAIAGLLAAGGTAVLYAAGGLEGELPIVLPSIAVIATFASAHLVLLGMLAEVVVRVGDYRESQTILFEVETGGRRSI